mgnify:CR=1 FL=1
MRENYEIKMKKLFKIINKSITIFCLLVLIINNVYGQNSSLKFKVTAITENVYSIVSPYKGLPTPENKGWNSNSHFVITKNGVILFDTGSSETIGNKIKVAIKSVTNQPVRWVVNSHSHADHWLGNSAFKDAEFITTKDALLTMKKYGKDDLKFYSKVTKGTIGNTQLKYPTTILTNEQKRNLGGIDVEFIFSNNGHSPGDILMWLPKQKIIFGGDVLSSDWMPMISNYKNISNLINFLNNVVKLNPIIILTGHGKATTIKSIKRDAELLSSVRNLVNKEYQKGKTLNNTLYEVKLKLKVKFQFLYKDFDSEVERHIKIMYRLLNREKS